MKSTSFRKAAIKNKHTSTSSSVRHLLLLLVVFLSGCFFSSTILLHTYPLHHQLDNDSSGKEEGILPSTFSQQKKHADRKPIELQLSDESSSSSSIINGKRILIALASFDFAQFPLLEEVLDAYQDLCFAGAGKVDIYIHTTVPYTVALIDLLNTRLNCRSLQIYIVVVTPAVRLNLVDFHRTLFYEKIDEYDLFIYSEVRLEKMIQNNG